MNSTELDARLRESNDLLRRLTDLTNRGLLMWECREYHPIRLSADRESDPKTFFISHSFVVETRYKARLYRADVLESLQILNDAGYIMVEFDCNNGSGRYDYGSGKKPSVLNLFPKMDMYTFAGSVLPQIEGADAVVVGCADKDSPYIGAVLPDSIKAHPLTKLGEKLRDDQELVGFHRVVADGKFRSKLLSEFQN